MPRFRGHKQPVEGFYLLGIFPQEIRMRGGSAIKEGRQSNTLVWVATEHRKKKNGNGES